MTLMTNKKPPTRMWAILLWVSLILGMIWLATPRPASSQSMEDASGDDVVFGEPVLVEMSEPVGRSGTNPFELYPNGLEFDVYRKGSRVGTHKVTFEEDDNAWVVTSTFKLRVKVLFVTAYKFDFESTGVWRDGILQSLVAETNDNGKESSVDAYLSEDGKFYATGRKGPFVTNNWVYPTTHWNVGAVESDVVLNTLNGQLAKVEVLRKGIELVETKGGGAVDAERFEYTGELRDTIVWYDSDGRWVRMKFTTKQGETLDYVCRECGFPGVSEQISDASPLEEKQ
ncbi:MAG: DUF6134 family protein [Rhodospirillaceae bacterium]